MCGVAGIVGGRIDPAALHRMQRRLHHRGPEGRGTWIDEGVGLTHTRLRILDPTEAGAQPMWTPSGRFGIVYNGEVYGFRSLRSRLEGLGHTFHSDTDTEVVLHAWAQWGPEALDRLEGMFAFALWDRRERRLHLVRDRLGIKPLYWARTGGGTFVFASEVRAILASGLVERRLDRASLPFYLAQQTVPAPRTLVDGIRMLSPACRLHLDLRDGKATKPDHPCYWSLLEAAKSRRASVKGMDREDAVRGLRRRLEAAVRRRLVSDVQLGAFLSGGTDSTAVVGLMARASDSGTKTFTVAHDEAQYDDASYARLVAEQLQTDHREIRIEEEELVHDVPFAVAAQDHPSGDGVNTWIVSKAAKEAGLTVALSGVGGDELFGGYPSFRRISVLRKAAPVLSLLPDAVRRAFGTLATRMLPGVRSEKLADLICTDGSVPEAYPILRRVFSPRQTNELLGRDHELSGEEYRLYRNSLRQAFQEHPSTPPLARVSYAEVSCYMRDVLLRDTDQMGMAHSLEVRLPFLDREVLEYVVALPDAVREPSRPPKRFLAEAVDDFLPSAVARRSKQGFAMPFDRWMREALRGYCKDGLDCVADHEAFRSESVHRVWDAFLDHRVPWSRPWLLVALGHWLDRERLL